MKQAVIVLNFDHQIINIVSWKRAFVLVEKGRAEVVEDSETTISNFEGTYKFSIPAIIKLVRFVKNVYKASVAFTRRNLHIRDKGQCQYCSSTEDLTIDHVKPSSQGGKTSWDNCVTACHRCNSRKADKTPEEVGMKLKTKPKHPSVVQYLQAKVEMLKLNYHVY